jgi:hypothetical protein
MKSMYSEYPHMHDSAIPESVIRNKLCANFESSPGKLKNACRNSLGNFHSGLVYQSAEICLQRLSYVYIVGLCRNILQSV